MHSTFSKKKSALHSHNSSATRAFNDTRAAGLSPFSHPYCLIPQDGLEPRSQRAAGGGRSRCFSNHCAEAIFCNVDWSETPRGETVKTPHKASFRHHTRQAPTA